MDAPEPPPGDEQRPARPGRRLPARSPDLATSVDDLGTRDRNLLAYAVCHGMVSVEQVAARFFASTRAAQARLRTLERAELITVDRVLVGGPTIVRATARGTRLSGCDLPPASLELGRIRHALALVELSEELLAAHPASTWVSERELRRDRMRAARSRGRWERQLRVPDGLLRLPDGRTIAIELDLTAKRSARLDLLAGAYAVDPEIDIVWWYLPSRRAAERMRALVMERGLDHLVEPRARRVMRPM